jgi:hypothetical protein
VSYASEQGVLNAQWNAAEMAFQAEVARCRPHVLMRPSIRMDGNMWCALYGDNLQEGVAGFGISPELAMHDFDAAWIAAREVK